MAGMNNINQKSNTKIDTRQPIWVTRQTRPFLDDFDRVKQLGRDGQYAVTYQCARKSDGKSFAVKHINKNRFNTPQFANFYRTTMLNEINNLNILHHQTIVNLECVYEDADYLYIVMEHCKGGDLFQRIIQRGRYSEKEAKYVIKQLLLALRYMHDDKGIIHCDIKPDNIVFTDNTKYSIPKFIDFGMSKFLPRSQYATNVCGSPHYMAPEITQKNIKYNHSADMWSIGILIYNMILGYPPFYVPPQNDQQLERKALYNKIQNGFQPIIKSTSKYGYGPWFPDNIKISKEARDLISKLLQNDMDKRYTAKNALCHSWFADLNENEGILSRLLRYNKDNAFKCVFSTIFRNTFYKERREHIEQLQQLFVEYDIDGDGIWSLKELKDMIKSMNCINIDDKDINTIYLRLCSVSSVGISFYDLLDAMVYDYIISSDEQILTLFKELDENNIGQITPKQLKEKLSEVDSCKQWNAQIIFIKASCIDPNGGLFYEELLVNLHPKFQQTPEWITNLFAKKPSDSSDSKCSKKC